MHCIFVGQHLCNARKRLHSTENRRGREGEGSGQASSADWEQDRGRGGWGGGTPPLRNVAVVEVVVVVPSRARVQPSAGFG